MTRRKAYGAGAVAAFVVIMSTPGAGEPWFWEADPLETIAAACANVTPGEMWAPLCSATAPAAPYIMEDGPAWDCRVMGNRICGGDGITPAGYETDTGAWVGGYN